MSRKPLDSKKIGSKKKHRSIANERASASTVRSTRSNKRTILFYGITAAIPLIFFLLLETGLRWGNYMGDLALFSDPGIGKNEYYLPNPNFAARYFFYTKTVPSPSIDVFKQEKTPDIYRVFAMGGSSAAGYPYGFNGTYSRVVKDILQDRMPNKQVEVVNVGISAISSYTLYDQVAEILQQKPDAILIYAGHNEFYGALGVGSNENLGGFPWFVRGYLKLQQYKTFLLLRNTLVGAGKWTASLFGAQEIDPNATLMERIINSRSIALDGPKHQLAMHQFDSNLSAILEEFTQQGIPVWLGSLASNYKDQAPFVDVPDALDAQEQPLPLASTIFQEGQSLLVNGDADAAQNQFAYAKDLDGLKFRAPESINQIIREKATEYEQVHYVPVYETFVEHSPNGIVGNELMLEHLHPNAKGYFLMGASFAQAMLENERLAEWVHPPLNNIESERQTGNGLIEQNLIKQEFEAYEQGMYLSDFDHRVAYHRVRTLKQGFPFVLSNNARPYQQGYKPTGPADSLAFLAVHASKSWDESKVELGGIYERNNEPEKAFLEYMGLIRNQPWNDSPYVFAARVRLNQNDFDAAEPLLEQAYSIQPKEGYTTKMLGAIMVQKGDLERGITLLLESRALSPRDPQMLYNLSGAYGLNKNYTKALEIAEEVIAINPNFPGIQQWKAQLQRALN
jgi:lysophospholipase L1-like esterase